MLESQGQAHSEHHRLRVSASGSRVPQPDVDVARSRRGRQERLQKGSRCAGDQQIIYLRFLNKL